MARVDIDLDIFDDEDMIKELKYRLKSSPRFKKLY